MFSYGGYRKRSRDTRICEECEEEEIDLEDDDWDVCGDCQRTMCSDCIRSRCDFCKQQEEKGDHLYVENSVLCEMCTETCEDCEDMCFHKPCLVEHMKVCTKKSRAQRAFTSAKKQREQTQESLNEARTQLASLQERVQSLERDLAISQENEAKAEVELKAEVKADTKKE